MLEAIKSTAPTSITYEAITKNNSKSIPNLTKPSIKPKPTQNGEEKPQSTDEVEAEKVQTDVAESGSNKPWQEVKVLQFLMRLLQSIFAHIFFFNMEDKRMLLECIVN